MKANEPLRGEVWMADLEPVKGHEQGARRPVVIVSANALNNSPADVVIVLPVTSQNKGIRSHVLVKPPEGGLTRQSYIITEQPRAITKERLSKRLGMISRETFEMVEKLLSVILEL